MRSEPHAPHRLASSKPGQNYGTPRLSRPDHQEPLPACRVYKKNSSRLLIVECFQNFLTRVLFIFTFFFPLWHVYMYVVHVCACVIQVCGACPCVCVCVFSLKGLVIDVVDFKKHGLCHSYKAQNACLCRRVWECIEDSWITTTTTNNNNFSYLVEKSA